MKQTAEIIGALVLDLILQDYPKSSDFIQYDNVTHYVKLFWPQVLQKNFDDLLKREIQLGNNIVQLPESWYSKKKLEVKKEDSLQLHYAKIPSIITLKGDENNISIKNILPVKSSCHSTITIININQRNNVSYLPKNDNNGYAFIYGDEIRFVKLPCDLKEIEISYLPGMDDENEDIKVPDVLAAETAVLVYNLINSARQGNQIVDKTANNNSNKVIQTEIAQ